MKVFQYFLSVVEKQIEGKAFKTIDKKFLNIYYAVINVDFDSQFLHSFIGPEISSEKNFFLSNFHFILKVTTLKWTGNILRYSINVFQIVCKLGAIPIRDIY